MSKEFKGRREDHRLVTGQGRYASDWNLPGQLYGHFLRSDRAHAEIVSLNAQPALAAPGVVAVFTGADTAKANFKVAPPLVKFHGRRRHPAHGLRRQIERDIVVPHGCGKRYGVGGTVSSAVGSD